MHNLASTSEQLIFDGSDYLAILIHEIENAKQEVLVSNYIIESDHIGTKIMDALKKKAQSGVKVRLIVDGYGSWQWIDNQLDSINTMNFAFHIYHPLPWMISKFAQKQGHGWIQIIKFLSRINHRIHQKVFVFDGQKMIIGSRNIHDGSVNWRETSLLIEGEAVKEVVKVFEKIWVGSSPSLIPKFKKRKKKLKVASGRIFSNYRKLKQSGLRRARDKMRAAKFRIQITTPYFLLTRSMTKLLLIKMQAGVEVSILVPNVSDLPFYKWITSAYYDLLLDGGARIYEYAPKILHAKTTIVDDWGMVGSSNFNKRSLFWDVELDYCIENKNTLDALLKKFEEDCQNSVRISQKRNFGIFKKIFFKLITNLIPSWF